MIKQTLAKGLLVAVTCAMTCGASYAIYNGLVDAQVRKTVEAGLQARRDALYNLDVPYRTINQRYGKSGLWGILAIGEAKSLSCPEKEIYREQYKRIVEEYGSLASDYARAHPEYMPKEFYSDVEIFGKQEKCR